MEDDSALIDTILTFWFGFPAVPLKELDAKWKTEPEYVINNALKWYKKDEAFDNEIREKFGDLVDKVGTGEKSLDSWLNSPKGVLAALVVLDQFPRNLFRGSPKAFSYDTKALAVTLSAVEKGFDRQMQHPMQAALVYHPFVHSEELDMQALSLKKFQEVRENVDPTDAGYDHTGLNVKSAQAHYDIVAKFGRFPHRNVVLGRESTPEEVEHLKVHAGF